MINKHLKQALLFKVGSVIYEGETLMKHAIMILAHKNIGQICRLVEYFDRNCEIYIHIDRKQCVKPEDKEKLLAYRQVKLVTDEYEVYWGGTSVLESELYLLRLAVQQSGADYFHLISGQDYPTRPLSYFLNFFNRNVGKEYISYIHLPHPNWESNTFHRLQYYFPYDYAAGQENPRQWVREQVWLQRSRGVKRPIPDEFDHLYGCSQWFSITRNAATTLLDYTDRSPSFYNRMWMTFAPEECYVATVLVNLLGKDNIVSLNQRFIRWKYENGNRPANLGCEHFRYLLENECLIARKIELPYSNTLLDWVDRYLHTDHKIELKPTGGWIYDGFMKYRYDKKFANYVARMWFEIGARMGLDMGCGTGAYVAQWRSRGLSFAGYDANTYTQELSAMLLPDGDTPCGVADLTDELESDCNFDIVACKDVLPYIPQELEHTAIMNLTKLSTRFIILSWDVHEELAELPHRKISEDALLPLLAKEGFVIERYMTGNLRVILKRKNCCVLTKEKS